MYCPIKNCDCLNCSHHNDCVLLTAETKAIQNAEKLSDIEQKIKELHNMLFNLLQKIDD